MNILIHKYKHKNYIFSFKKTEVLGHIIILIILTLSSLFSAYIMFSYISLFCFFVYCIWLTMKFPAMIIKYLYIFFVIISNIVGVAVDEFSGSFLLELGRHSYFVGSLPLIILARWIFMAVLFIYDRVLNVDKKVLEIKETKNPWINYLSFTVAILYTVIFANVAKNPSFIIGIDRFVYGTMYIQGIWASLDSLARTAIVIPAFALKSGNKKIAIYSIVVYGLYLFWTGSKFGGFFIVAYTIFIVFYDRLLESGIKKMRTAIIVIIMMFIALIGLAVVAYYFTDSRGTEGFLSYRIGCQGELWWDIYGKYNGDYHPQQFINEIKGLTQESGVISDNLRAKYGIYNIMYLSSASNSQIDAKILRGSRYTEAGYAAMFYYFGEIGVILYSLFWGVIYATTINMLVDAIRRNDGIVTILLLRLNIKILTGISMFLFRDLLRLSSVLSYIYIGLKNKIDIKIKM